MGFQILNTLYYDYQVFWLILSLIMKQSRTLWLLSPSLPCSHPAFCLWKIFSQRISWIREVRKCRSKEKERLNNNSLVIKLSQGLLVPPQGLQIIFWAISCELSHRYWNPTSWKKLTTWWPDYSHDISCHNSENWPQGNGNKPTLELKIHCN